MKKYLTIIVGVLVVGAWIFFYDQSDYSWAELMTQKKTAEGWTLVATQDNFGDLARPWTWLKTPVTGLWFIKMIESRQLGSIVLVPILRVSYDYSKTEQNEYFELFDVSKGNSAILEANVPIEKINFSTIEWNNYKDGTPGDKLIKYVQKARLSR